jgi:hypothetical protein
MTMIGGPVVERVAGTLETRLYDLGLVLRSAIDRDG